jgi:hypothetical protein
MDEPLERRRRLVIPAKAGIHEHRLWQAGLKTVFMGPGWSLSSGRPKAGPVGRDDRRRNASGLEDRVREG